MDFVYSIMKKRMKLVPFWATENMSEVTSLKVLNTAPQTLEAVNGGFVTPCEKPCLATEVTPCLLLGPQTGFLLINGTVTIIIHT